MDMTRKYDLSTNVKRVKIAVRIADHIRENGGTHADAIRIIIKQGVAADAGEADALLYDADTFIDCSGRGAL